MAEEDAVLLPERDLVRSHAPKVLRPVEALVAQGGRVFIAAECVKVSLVDSLIARLAVHILIFIVLLHLVANLIALEHTQHIRIRYLVNLLLALGTFVLYLFDPLIDAWVTVGVSARVELGDRVHGDFVKADAAGFELLLRRHLLDSLTVVFDLVAHSMTTAPLLQTTTTTLAQAVSHCGQICAFFRLATAQQVFSLLGLATFLAGSSLKAVTLRSSTASKTHS